MNEVIIVNKNDEIIGYKSRNNRSPEDIIRIAGIWIENENGEVLIAQRSINKKMTQVNGVQLQLEHWRKVRLMNLIFLKK